MKGSEESLKKAEKSLNKKLDYLDNCIILSVKLEKLEKDMNDVLSEGLRPKIQVKIAQSIIFLKEGKIEDAEKIISDEIEPALKDANEQSMGDDNNYLQNKIQNLLDGLTNRSKIVNSVSKAKTSQPTINRRWNWLAIGLAKLSGVQTLNAEFRYWFIRPFLWLVLLVVLVLLGLQTLYVNAGASFGVNGLYDYLGLFLWGLSADIANQGLRRLQSGNNKEEGETKKNV